eukprot:gene411-biopygen8576
MGISGRPGPEFTCPGEGGEDEAERGAGEVAEPALPAPRQEQEAGLAHRALPLQDEQGVHQRRRLVAEGDRPRAM